MPILAYLLVGVLTLLVALAVARRPRLSFFVNLLLIGVYAVLLLYYYKSRVSLGFDVIWENRTSLFYLETLTTIVREVGWTTLIIVALILGVVIAIEWRWKFLPRCTAPRRFWFTMLVISFGYIIFNAMPVYTYDDFNYLLRTNFKQLTCREHIPVAGDTVRYPYVKKAIIPYAPPPEKLPHVFIIAMESFNANFVEARTPDGHEYTPCFNALVPRGVYIERYYGNSIQTARGHLAMMFSILPSTGGKVFTDYSALRLHSLPQILREHGYTTVFMQGGWSLDFDNTGPFLSRNGFDYVGTPDNLQRDSSWGAPDNVTYREFFKRIDAIEKTGGKHRYFGFIATISNHRPFSSRTKNDLIALKALRSEELIPNSTNIADSFLPVFFEELRKRPFLSNCIVIITDDHSYPANEHGNVNNEIGCWEENFRTPLLILWKDRLIPRRLFDEPFSHIDLAPTILDMLKIRADNHFIGQSILHSVIGKRTICLIQPYGGIYLSTIRWPLKYVLHVGTGHAWLYNLERDPKEEKNVISAYEGTSSLIELRRGIGMIGLNQRLIEQDRIWPAK